MDDQTQSLYEEVAAFALNGLIDEQFEEGRKHVEAIVDDWIDQADESDINEVVEIGQEELLESLVGQDAQERLGKLRRLVLERQVEKLSGRSLQLALKFAGGQRSSEEAGAEAALISEVVDALLPEVHALNDADLRRRLIRELADADFETRYILAGGSGIVSIRLYNMLSQRRDDPSLSAG